MGHAITGKPGTNQCRRIEKPGMRLNGFARHVRAALRDQLSRFGVQHTVEPEGSGSRLPRVVVRSRADATAAEHHVAGCKRAPEEFGQCVPVVAQVAGPVEREAALTEQADDAGEVLVLALAGQDFIADDDQAETGCRGTHRNAPIIR
jgi:hypothetical protein